MFTSSSLSPPMALMGNPGIAWSPPSTQSLYPPHHLQTANAGLGSCAIHIRSSSRWRVAPTPV
ncbi:hypothetical protein BS47DRAFT_1351887 [Hydnum rufescens UP504]|uniref:Uncharacterized protein n=1 Tax=Hydnum rufescens UP504 TaxID=1448309 RepID=A0A9P6AM11_9AGAM|nr:hypothetical protein BS47DRAFT_1351887 [Hydnum rufescens UP504]